MKNGNNISIVTLAALAFAFAPVVRAAPSPDGDPISLRANQAPSPEGGPADLRATPEPRVRPTPAPRPNSSPNTPVPRVRPTPAPRPNSGPVNLAANEGIDADSEPNSADSVSAEDKRMPVITIHSTDNVTRGKTGSFVLNMNPPVMLGGMYVQFKVSGTANAGIDYVPLVSPAYIGRSGYGTILVQTLLDPRASSIRQAYSVVVTLEAAPGYSVGQPSSATMWIKP